jgi:predicted O-methyltransferase YrrM
MYGIYYNIEWMMRGWALSLIKANKLKKGAELGTYMGGTTFFLLDNEPDLVLHTVDIFDIQPDHPDYKKPSYDFTERYPEFLEKAKKYGDRLIVHKGWTHEVAKKIPDASLDFVLIDADHRYEGCKRDILLWRSKIRPGGLLMGHDIQEPGVRKATSECCDKLDITEDVFCWVEPQLSIKRVK